MTENAAFHTVTSAVIALVGISITIYVNTISMDPGLKGLYILNGGFIGLYGLKTIYDPMIDLIFHTPVGENKDD